MKISIITPSYNQAHFIEETIRSVLDQNYNDLEYIVMDGGSTDGTVDILKKYSDRIHWISEKDSGQSDAINKGLKIATGEIVAYLNSDDTYEPNALARVAKFFRNNPEIKWACGQCRIISGSGKEIRRPITLYKNLFLKHYSYARLLSENFISQPATFWKRELLSDVGFFDETEHLCMDYDYWLRIGRKYPPGFLPEFLANFRYYTTSKSGSSFVKQMQDQLRLAERYGTQHPIALWFSRINCHKIVWAYKLLLRLGY